jgi:hypothetical protein
MNLCPVNGIDTFAQFNGHHAEWKDDMQSFSNTDPAMDLTAASPSPSPGRWQGRPSKLRRNLRPGPAVREGIRYSDSGGQASTGPRANASGQAQNNRYERP